MDINSFLPSIDLHLAVRAGFVAQGTSMTRWCKDNGVKPSNAKSALVGVWNGPKGKAMRTNLVLASGISSPPHQLQRQVS